MLKHLKAGDYRKCGAVVVPFTDVSLPDKLVRIATKVEGGFEFVDVDTGVTARIRNEFAAVEQAKQWKIPTATDVEQVCSLVARFLTHVASDVRPAQAMRNVVSMNEPTFFGLVNGQVGVVHGFAAYICHNEAISLLLKERAEARKSQ